MITTALRRHDLVGNGTAGPFVYQFLITHKTYLQVYVDGALKTVDVHYTVAGVGTESGGTVTFTTGNEPASLAHIQFIGAEAFTQLTDYVNAGSFPAASHEEALDKQIRLATQLKEQLTRVPVLSPPDHYNLSPLVLKAPVAGQFLRWSALGHEVEPAVPTTTPSGLPVGGNHDHLVIDEAGTVEWSQQIYNFSANFLNVSKYTSFATAISTIGAVTKVTLLISSSQAVAGNVTPTPNIRCLFVGTGALSISAGIVVTFDSPEQIQADPRTQIFTGAGTVTFTKAGRLPIGWHGSVGDASTDNAAALQAASTSLAAGGELMVPGGQFNANPSATITLKSRMVLQGCGMELSRIHNTNAAGVDLFTWTDTATANDELRYAGIKDVYVTGNAASGSGLVVNNPLHFTAEQVLVSGHGGIGIDFQKGVGGSTFGQNIWLTRCWVTLNESGGVRLGTATSNGSDIVHLRECSINENAYYGVYVDRHSLVTIESCEFAAYYYGAVIAAHQAVPIAINGGSCLAVKHCSFENNGGNGATPNYQIRTGWNGDTQADASNTTQVLILEGNSFKAAIGQADGALDHVRLRFVQVATLAHNFFEKASGYPDAVRGINMSADTLSYGGFSFEHNFWQDTLDAKVEEAGAVRPLQWKDVHWDSLTTEDIPGYGYRVDTVTQVPFWVRYASEGFDRYQVLGDGTIVRGLGAAAPTVKILVGAGTPEGAITAGIGSLYQRTDGGAGTSLYVKQSGTGNTGWSAVTP